MSTFDWVILGLLAAATLASLAGWARIHLRLRAVAARVDTLEGRLTGLDVTAEHAVQTAQAAAALARRGGADEPRPPPRVVLEPVTGPVVKALAWGAGARRVVTRLTHTTRSEPR